MLENLNSYAYKDKYCIDFLIQLFEWCDKNNKENEHTDSLNKFFYMKKNISNKYCHLSNFIHPDGTKREECEGKTLDLCENCCFCMSGEMRAVMNFKPDTLLAGLKLRV